MNVYVIDRIDKYTYCDDYKAVVIAEDALRAERLARTKCFDWGKAELKVTQIDLTKETILAVENVGA